MLVCREVIGYILIFKSVDFWLRAINAVFVVVARTFLSNSSLKRVLCLDVF